MIENIWKAFNAEGVNHNVLEALGQTVWVTVRLVPQKQSDQSPNHLHLYLHLESMLANICGRRMGGRYFHMHLFCLVIIFVFSPFLILIYIYLEMIREGSFMRTKHLS